MVRYEKEEDKKKWTVVALVVMVSGIFPWRRVLVATPYVWQ